MSSLVTFIVFKSKVIVVQDLYKFSAWFCSSFQSMSEVFRSSTALFWIWYFSVLVDESPVLPEPCSELLLPEESVPPILLPLLLELLPSPLLLLSVIIFCEEFSTDVLFAWISSLVCKLFNLFTIAIIVLSR